MHFINYKLSNKSLLQHIFINNECATTNTSDHLEDDYLCAAIDSLFSVYPDLLDKFSVHLFFNDNKGEIVDSTTTNKRKIYIVYDEFSRPATELLSSETIVFQSYLHANAASNDKGLFHFPIGPNKHVPVATEIKQTNERTTNVFFSGNLHIGRFKLFKAISEISFLPFSISHRLNHYLGLKFDQKFDQSYIRFTNGFAKGFTPEVYGHYLNNSKIVLCPGGSVSVETFRHYEAMRAGAVVISEKQPDKLMFTQSPMLQVENWKEGLALIPELLKDKELLNTMGAATAKWYQEHYAAPAIANYMLRCMQEYFGTL